MSACRLLDYRILFGVTLLGVACAGLAAAAENWPQWRGPSAGGVAADGQYPVDFSNAVGVAGKVALPGVGCSTPAVWGKQIVVTCAIDGKDGVVSYDMAGNELWRRQFGPTREAKHRNGSGSNPSPVTDGRYVAVYYKSGTVAGLDLAGKVLWSHNLQDRYGKDTLWWDLGTSPVLEGGRVVVAVMQEGPSYLVAIDAASGEIVWKTDRDYDNQPESDQAYTTPQVVRLDGRDVVVTWGADHLTGHDLASGELLWECGGFNPDNEGMWRVIASAPIDAGLALVPYGRGKFLAGVRLGGRGDITNSSRLWEKSGLGSDVPTAVVQDGQAIVLTDVGRLVCLEMRSGDERWSADLPRNRNKYYASPVLAGDLLYCTREDGVVFVGRVGDGGFELLAENDMGESVIATPIPLRGGLLVRGTEHLFRIAH